MLHCIGGKYRNLASLTPRLSTVIPNFLFTTELDEKIQYCMPKSLTIHYLGHKFCCYSSKGRRLTIFQRQRTGIT